MSWRFLSRIIDQAKGSSSESKSGFTGWRKHHNRNLGAQFYPSSCNTDNISKSWSYLSPFLISALSRRTPCSQQHSTAKSCLGESWQGRQSFKWLLPIHAASTCCHCSLSKSSAGWLTSHCSDWKCQQTQHRWHASAAAEEDLRGGSGQSWFTAG